MTSLLKSFETRTTDKAVNDFVKDLDYYYIPELKRQLTVYTKFYTTTRGFNFQSLESVLSSKIKDFVTKMRSLFEFLNNQMKQIYDLNDNNRRAERFETLNTKIQNLISSQNIPSNNQQPLYYGMQFQNQQNTNGAQYRQNSGGKRHRKNQTRRNTNRRKRSHRHY